MKSFISFISYFIVGIILFAICGTVFGGSGGAEIAIYLGFIILIYLIPSLLAYSRKVPSKLSISILNVFLGWTLIGWVVSLIWAAKNFDYVPPDLRKNK